MMTLPRPTIIALLLCTDAVVAVCWAWLLFGPLELLVPAYDATNFVVVLKINGDMTKVVKHGLLTQGMTCYWFSKAWTVSSCCWLLVNGIVM